LLEVGTADILVGVAVRLDVMPPVVLVLGPASVAFTQIQTARWLEVPRPLNKPTSQSEPTHGL
jgi:hypothetical protein